MNFATASSFYENSGVKKGKCGNHIDRAIKRKYSKSVGIKRKRRAYEDINQRALCFTINDRPCRT